MFPHEHFTIVTALDPDAVRQRLSTVVEPPKTFRWQWGNPDKPYQGEIGDRSFKISRIIHYRNSFLPVIDGRIEPNGTGSKISINMKLHPFVLVFMLVWLSMVGQIPAMFLMGILFALFTDQKEQVPIDSESYLFLLFPLGMFVFGCGLPLIGFWPEARKSKAFLIDLLEKL
ncbi:hypothetical protein [Oxynema aestuarii]|jgi:hypothetical protein|uniref:Uncharacterized protein n=1 Tax=Oxynema aestuarii AP17 TaxID=2064643 RepID=A0A6H1U0W5_9CYAN|nr:hypothetical protein [Oxynema aestuarii]QIZ72295.1 hypothetical protein HCG48_18360 [Oxynema aestuarii AP17]